MGTIQRAENSCKIINTLYKFFITLLLLNKIDIKSK